MKIDPGNLDFRESHHIFTSSIVPRPVILISTVGENGVFNVAPFSSIVTVSVKPRLEGIEISTRRDGQKKDTLRNIEFSKEFVINIIEETMAEAMNQTSVDYPPDVSEFKEAGLTPVKADIVKAPMVGESPINMECRLVQTLQFGEFPRISCFVIGEVVLIHIKEQYYVDGSINTLKLKTIGRLGGDFYCRTADLFKVKRAFNL